MAFIALLKLYPKVEEKWDSLLKVLFLFLFRLRAERTEFPGGVCKIKCKADIAGGVWATSQSQVRQTLRPDLAANVGG